MKLMGRYINKDTLMAEINKLKDKAYPNSDWNHGYVASCEKILSFLNALEVKEVDLEKEIKNAINEYYNECEKKLQEMNDNDTDISFLQLDKFAKHFFKLGLNAQMKTSLREKDDGKNT